MCAIATASPTTAISTRARARFAVVRPPIPTFALFARAVRSGQEIGATNSRGQRPRTRAVGPQNILGTVYHTLGIDPTIAVPDFSGRPRQLLDDGEPIRELML